MCGIAGFWDISRKSGSDHMAVIASRMSDALLHRGPDSGGTWVDEKAGIAFGHRRLAVLDLSSEGHQPMVSHNGRYIIVFNGEIYNFRELQVDLEGLGHHFHSRCDTEVMLASFVQWGIEEAVKRFNGMFAFALWDKEEEALYLARDRLGEKPLYYGRLGQTFFFTSELKALKAHPAFSPHIDSRALTLYMKYGYIPAPYSIYQGIYKLLPACFLKIRADSDIFKPTPYWSFDAACETGVRHQFKGSEAEAVSSLDTLLRDAVGLRMISDVPLGVFLSGGIDSSTVAALMQAQSRQPVKTFTIGFYEDSYNEARDAQNVAKYLGTDHTELYITPQEARAVIPQIPFLYDEPFADSSQIPTFLVSKLARQRVTVSLSGDGGDEVFCGYNNYLSLYGLGQKMRSFPYDARRMLSYLLIRISEHFYDYGQIHFNTLTPLKLKDNYQGQALRKILKTLSYFILALKRKDNAGSYYNSLEVNLSVIVELANKLNSPKPCKDLAGFIHRLMYLDTIIYLPDDILVKVDRASMGVSLESRAPFLDHRVVEFAWGVPLELKIRDKKGKYLLRQVLYRYVPEGLIDRPKKGFALPIGRWLCGPLRDWAAGLLEEKKLLKEGFFNPGPVQCYWKEHLSGYRNWENYLWRVLMFQAWLGENKKVI